MMYIQLDKDDRCISACSERQNENDVMVEEHTDEFLNELDYYVYDNGKFIKDETYKPVIPKSQIEILQETVEMLLLDSLEVL